ncbi:nuclear transcription factor Y subunit beta-like [Paramacrobiotus metropolitanus]|uniref:nuclear transcription factor Y subunit beta-like n=1 Tax=Paramacrobiotus metropolitanus TaxID=2943436 RepID=UPI0024462075|nr:nuclear transcription factor Y subunit beta-like [Paramacrobiotus metropolitanus]
MSNYGTVEVRIPILQRGESVIDQYGQRSQFDDEMRKMEAEMQKLTGEISEGNKRIASRVIQTTKTTTTRTSSGTGFDNQNQQFAIQPQPIQQQGGNVQSHTSQTHQTFTSGGTQFDQPQDFNTQGANVIESRRTVTTHKTVTHSGSGQNLLQNVNQPPQPQAVQWASPAGSNVQESRSHHTTTSTSHTGGQQQFQTQPQPIQWGAPAGSQQSNAQETRSFHSSTTTSHTGQQQHHQQQNQNTGQMVQFDQQNNQELQSWLSNLNSPLISNHQDISGQDGKCLKLRFDVSQYRPDEVSVKMVDGKLRIHAKHEEKTENKSSYREFNKEFSLPIGTNPELIKSSLSKDGILTVEAPFPGQLTGQQYLPLTNY